MTLYFHADSDFAFWSQWIAANVVGELLGLGLVGATGYAAIHIFGDPETASYVLAFAALIISLGAIEGAIVGYAQVLVLRRRLPQLKAWIAATSLGAVLAWTLGMIPSTAIGYVASTPSATPSAISDAMQLLLAIPLGLLAGTILGLPQWFVLRKHVAHAGWWILANALAWACGMPLVFLVTGAGWSDSLLSAAVLAALGLAAASALVGAIHGLFLVKLLAPLRDGRSTA